MNYTALAARNRKRSGAVEKLAEYTLSFVAALGIIIVFLSALTTIGDLVDGKMDLRIRIILIRENVKQRKKGNS